MHAFTLMTNDAGGRRIGLAGAGWVAPHHLEAWQRLPGRATVVAIADPNVEAARVRAKAYGVPSVYSSVEAMLEREGMHLDAVDVATPRETHAPICRLVADRGLAILSQKPLAPTFAEAASLVADIGGRVRLMVHENWRFRPHYRRIAGWLRDDRVGEIHTVTMTLFTSGLIADPSGLAPAIERQPMFATLERLLVMEVLIHHVDTLRFLLGPLTLAGASLGRSCPLVRGEDRASILMTTTAGAAVSLVGDLAAHGHPAVQRDRLEIQGSTGAILLERDRLRLVRGAGNGGSPDEDVAIDFAADYEASYLGAITHFLDRLDDGGAFETSPEDNLETLRIVEQVYQMTGSVSSARI
jgi:predicted dehydrogenase